MNEKWNPTRAFLTSTLDGNLFFFYFPVAFFPAKVRPPRAGSGPGENIFHVLQQGRID